MIFPSVVREVRRDGRPNDILFETAARCGRIISQTVKQDEKRALRRRIGELAGQYGEEWRREASRQIWERVERLPQFRRAHTVALYWSLKDEVETHGFVRKWCVSKRIVLPEVRGEEMVFREYDPAEGVTPGAFGIGEARGAECPAAAIDLVVVPGVAFDRSGGRMGRGKGFYDRFLTGCRACKVGVCFGYQLVGAIPCEEHDVRMDAVVSVPDMPGQ